MRHHHVASARQLQCCVLWIYFLSSFWWFCFLSIDGCWEGAHKYKNKINQNTRRKHMKTLTPTLFVNICQTLGACETPSWGNYALSVKVHIYICCGWLINSFHHPVLQSVFNCQVPFTTQLLLSSIVTKNHFQRCKNSLTIPSP